MPEVATVLKPTEKTLRLLYAKSGNRCAFPFCPMPISDGQTLFGEAAHIKAESPGGPRYDPSQTAEERRSFDNLILLCGVHHKCVDADPISYTVERLKQMKCDHEAKAGKIDEDEVNRVVELLVAGDVRVTAINPYNSITAGIFHQNITNNFGTVPNHQEIAQPYQGVLPKEGYGRFRGKGRPLGQTQSIMPFQMEPSSNISLGDGPCFWFRMLPSQAPTGEWTFHDLEVAAGNSIAFRLVTMHGHADYRFNAKDGIGRYLSITPGIAYSASFLFRTGEVWSIDTELCVRHPQKLFALSVVRKELPELVVQFAAILTALKVPTPFRWIAGVEGAERYGLAFDRRNGYQYVYPLILTDQVVAEGLYSPGNDVSAIIDTFTRKVFAECGQEQPADII